MNWNTDFTACVNIKTQVSLIIYLVLYLQYTDYIALITAVWSGALRYPLHNNSLHTKRSLFFSES